MTSFFFIFEQMSEMIYAYLLMLVHLVLNVEMKDHRTRVRKTTMIRKRYNQGIHLTQDATWEVNKNAINITDKKFAKMLQKHPNKYFISYICINRL